MRRRPSKLVLALGAVVVAASVIAGSEAKVPMPSEAAVPLLAIAAPHGRMGALPQSPRYGPTDSFDGLEERARQASADAAAAGARISAVVLDRNTGQIVSNGDVMSIAIASVVKLFIADDMLLQESQGQSELSPADRTALDVMLRSSDDSAADVFWNRNGGSAIISRVVARYQLGSTGPPEDGRWFNTVSTASDLVRYYDMLLSGAGGLPPERADIILSNLAASTPMAIDGTQPGGVYPQRFGIPEGLFAQPVAVKQGWMCCVGEDWMHLSTGVIGLDRRFVMAISSMQPGDDATARNTITQAVKTMFPDGRI